MKICVSNAKCPSITNRTNKRMNRPTDRPNTDTFYAAQQQARAIDLYLFRRLRSLFIRLGVETSMCSCRLLFNSDSLYSYAHLHSSEPSSGNISMRIFVVQYVMSSQPQQHDSNKTHNHKLANHSYTNRTFNRETGVLRVCERVAVQVCIACFYVFHN